MQKVNNMPQGNNWMLYATAATVYIANMVNGMIAVWTSPMIPILLSEDSPVPLQDYQTLWVVSTMAVGAFVSTLPVGLLVPRLGAKRLLLSSVAPALIGTEIASAASSFSMVILARILHGVYVGMVSAIIPSYLTDISRTANRGGLGLLSSACYNVGCLITFSVAPYMEYKQFQLLIQIVCILFLIIFIWMPESPYYLLSKGCREEAAKALALLRGLQNTSEVQSELDQMETTIKSIPKEKGTCTDLFRVRANRVAFTNLIVIVGISMLCGHNIILNYGGMIFKMSGSSIDPSLSVIVLGLVQLFSSVASSFVVDRFGRRPLMIVSTLGVGASLVPEIVYFYMKDVVNANTSSYDWVPLTFLVLFLLMFGFGLGALTPVYVSEIFNVKFKSVALAIGTMYGCILSFTASSMYISLAQSSGLHVSFLISAILSACATIFLIFYMPETKGKSLQEITDLLSEKKPEISNESRINPEKV